jgi:phosphate uptake regulator
MTRTTDDGGPIERKVQVTGGSTYTVSIPKAWATAHDIASGSPVHLYPFDDRLVVAEADDGGLQRARINVGTIGTESLGERVEAAYAAGADEVVVESDTGFDSAERRLASDTITGLVGVEIETETSEEIVARSLLDPAEVSLEGTIDQLRGISLSMHENAVRALIGADDDSEELARHVVSRDDDVDRLFALVSRQFYRALTDVREVDKLGVDRRIALTRFRTARQLERIADHAERIADVASRREEPPEPDLGDRFEAIATGARRVVRSALDGDTEEALSRRDDVVRRLDDLDRELYTADREGTYLDGRVIESIRRTAEYGGNVAEIVTLAEVADRS